MYTIDGDLKEFVESGVAVIVGTGDADGRPHVAYGWGPRVADDGSHVDVFLDSERAERTLRNLRSTRRVAMTLAAPVSYRSVQLKGVFTTTGEADEADCAWVRRHREAFFAAAALVGDPTEVIQNLPLEEVVRVGFSVERAFDQTPGPEAGKPL